MIEPKIRIGVIQIAETKYSDKFKKDQSECRKNNIKKNRKFLPRISESGENIYQKNPKHKNKAVNTHVRIEKRQTNKKQKADAQKNLPDSVAVIMRNFRLLFWPDKIAL